MTRSIYIRHVEKESSGGWALVKNRRSSVVVAAAFEVGQVARLQDPIAVCLLAGLDADQTVAELAFEAPILLLEGSVHDVSADEGTGVAFAAAAVGAVASRTIVDFHEVVVL